MKKITYNYNKLRDRIKEYFGTYENFAESLNISKESIVKKLNENNPDNFTQDEIFYCIKRLNIKPNELEGIFFSEKV